eukprot:bmy_16795T0
MERGWGGGGPCDNSAPFPQSQAGDPRPAPPLVRRRSSANYRAYATEPHAKVRAGPARWAGPDGTSQGLDSDSRVTRSLGRRGGARAFTGLWSWAEPKRMRRFRGGVYQRAGL